MNLRKALWGSAVLVLAACGGDETDSDKLETGTYQVSGAQLGSPTDACGFLAVYTDPEKKIGVVNDGGLVTFNLANDPDAATVTLPTANLSANQLTEATEANYLIAYDNGACNVRVKRSVTGEVVEDNKANVTLTFTVTKESGNCVADATDFAALPCDSAYNFTITKDKD